MLSAVSRKGGTDSIATNHGCDGITVTASGSSDVLINGIGVVRKDDINQVHLVPAGICVPHAVPLTKVSTTVFANGRGIGRIGDSYSGETLITGSSNVFAGG